MAGRLHPDARYLIMGREIRTLRLAQGLSQCELARRVGCAPSLISNTEKGLKSPGRHLASIARYFGLSAGDFTSLFTTCPDCAGSGVNEADPRTASLREALRQSRGA